MASSERGRASAWLLVVCLLVATAAVVAPASSLWARAAAEEDREQLVAVASEAAVLMSSLSAGDAGESLDRLAELGTGRFREEVAGRRAEVLRAVDEGSVRARAEVIAAGIEQDHVHRGPVERVRDTAPAGAGVLVATRAVVDNAAGAAGDERVWRWRVQTVLEGGRPLVASVEVAV